jgi:hypothetical protein
MNCLRLIAPSLRYFTAMGLCLALLGGCTASKPPPTLLNQTRELVAKTDDLGMLLLNTGLDPQALPAGKELTVREAQQLRLMLSLLLADGSMQRYGPRVAADFLMTEVIAGGKPVPRTALVERLHRFEQLAVLRPDGYLASVSTGSPVQCVGPIQVRDGTLQSGGYKFGTFYSPGSNGFSEVTRP